MTPQDDFHDPLAGWYVHTSPDETRDEGEWTDPDVARRDLTFALLTALVLVLAAVALAALYAIFAANPAMVL